MFRPLVKFQEYFAPALAGTLAVAALAHWFRPDPNADMVKRLPAAEPPAPGTAADPSADPIAGPGPAVDFRPTRIEGEVRPGPGHPANTAQSWPGFRGPARDGIRDGDVALARQWPETGPPVAWAVTVGEGYAGAAVHRGRVYVHDYDAERHEEAIRCLSAADGREIWRFAYPIHIRRNHGMSRTIPAVTDENLVAMGARGHVTGLDPTDGAKRWSLDLITEFGAREPHWYAGQCPLIDGDRAILGVGGTHTLMIAVAAATGEIIWRTPNPRGWNMSHSSIAPMNLHGRPTYVYAAAGGVVGVDAADGAILWETGEWHIRVATVPTPVVVDAERVFLAGGYNAGSLMLRIRPTDAGYQVETAFRLAARVFGADQQTPLLHDGHIYGVIPGGELACLDLEGNRLWSSGPGERFGLGPFLMADGMLLLLNDRGLLTLAEVSPAGYRVQARARVLTGHESWGPMAMADGHLIARDLTRMVSLDLRR